MADNTTLQQILAELREIRADVKAHREDHHALSKEVERVKIISGLWGSVSGALSTLGIYWLKAANK